MDDAPKDNTSTIDDSIATSAVAIFRSSPDLEKIDEGLNQISTTVPASVSTTAYTSVTEKLLEEKSSSTPTTTETSAISQVTTTEKPFKSLSSLLPSNLKYSSLNLKETIIIHTEFYRLLAMFLMHVSFYDLSQRNEPGRRPM